MHACMYVNIVTGINAAFCKIGIITAQHKNVYNLSRPSSLLKESEGPGGRGWQ